jgi:hypothetical protein
MNSQAYGSSDFFRTCMRSELWGALNLVRSNVKSNVWDQALYTHITNHGTVLSDELLNILSAFAERLKEGSRLSEIEAFYLASAAYLYDIGMQASNLELIGVGNGAQGTSFSREQIRNNCGILTADMIRKSNRQIPGYPTLGIIENEPLDVLATICSVRRYTELDSIDEIAMPQGSPVRLRLLASMLLLADQLFISHRRVRIDVLKESLDVPLQDRVLIWLNYYVQGVFIDRDSFIHAIFEIPEELAGLNYTIHKIVVENVCTGIAEKIWKLGIQTIVGNRRRIENLKKGEHRKELLPEDIQAYLRTDVTSVSRDVLMLIDYEGISTYLGRHGLYNIDTEQVLRKLVDAARPAGLLVKTIIYADWERYPEDAVVLNNLRIRDEYPDIQLINHNPSHGPVSAQIHANAQEFAYHKGQNISIIVVCSTPGLEDSIRILEQHGNVIIWAAGEDAEKAYKKLATTYAPVDNLIGVSLQSHIAMQIETLILQLLVVIFDNEITRKNSEAMLFEQIRRLIEEHATSFPDFQWGKWWANFCIYRGILISSERRLGNRPLYQLNRLTPPVMDALELRARVLETLEAMSNTNAEVNLEQLDRALRSNLAFSNDLGRRLWPAILLQDGLIIAPIASSTDKESISIDLRHPVVGTLAGRQHFDRLIVAIDDLLIAHQKGGWIKPWEVKQQLQRQPSPGLAEQVINSAFKSADREGMARFEQQKDVHGKSHYRLYLVRQHVTVQRYLDSRDTVICVAHDWCRMNNVVSRDKLSTLLRKVNFGDDETVRQKWISILEDEDILIPTVPEGADKLYRLADGHGVVNFVLVPYYSVELIFLVKEYDPTPEHPAPGVKWALNRLSHRAHSENIARAALDNAVHRDKSLRIKVIENPRIPGGKLSILDLDSNSAGVLASIEERKHTISERLVDILASQKKEWLSTQVLLDLLRPYKEFGKIDVERMMWIGRMVADGVLRTESRGTREGHNYQVYLLPL